ncbi:unnamed protein product [Heterobilharzia americana]|nr:unnamed protein product [Heterobilharzia americana]
MFIDPRKDLIHNSTIYLSTYALLVLLLFNTTIMPIFQLNDRYNSTERDYMYHLRGSEHFQPCIIQSDDSYPISKMIICNKEATIQFGNRLPIITQANDNQYQISTIRIENNPNIEICSTGTFENIMNDYDTITMGTTTTRYRGSIERKLILTGLSLHIFQYGCFKGLTELNVLHIENYQSTDGLKKLSGNLFQELKNLKRLKILHLENIDLSIGIPQYAFYGWIRHLKTIKLINNNLNTIHDEAFSLSTSTENKLIELKIEKQLDNGWKLLENSNKWAKYLYALKVFSLEGTNLQMTSIKTSSILLSNLKLDLGDYVNKNLEYLNIQNCGLTNLVNIETYNKNISGLNLLHLGGQLKQLYLGYNQFVNFNFLLGIKQFHNLQLLSINSNQIPLKKLPEWLSIQWPYLQELQLTSNGIVYIPDNSISNHLKVLHLSENPLKLFDNNWIRQYDDDSIKLSELHLNSIRLISVQLEGTQANWMKIFQPIKLSLEHLSLINCQLEAYMLNDYSSLSNTMNESDILTQKYTNKEIYLNLDLKSIKHLKSLILSGNYLEYIPPKLFYNLHELNSLVLTQNQLLTIQEYKIEEDKEENVYYTSKSIEHRLLRLDLSYNNLITMERCAYALGLGIPFESIIPLKPIWLAENQYNQYDEKLIINLKNTEYTTNQIYWLGGLNIIGNPFVCDCRLAWFRYFIDQMNRTFIQNEGENYLFSFKKYLNEAINFTCYGTNQWTGSSFLTLTLNDLYMVDHIDCMNRPDVYGQNAKSLENLQPCWKLNKTLSPNLEEIYERKNAILETYKTTGVLFRDNPSLVVLQQNATTVSKEALTLIIIAGVAALCFILVSLIIIIWLCIRLKRKTNHHQQQQQQQISFHSKKFYRERLNEVSCYHCKKLHCCPFPLCNLTSYNGDCDAKRLIQHCSLCGCSTHCSKHISSTSETINSLRPKSHRIEDISQTSIRIFANNTDQRNISPIYSEVTDLDKQETQSLNRYIDNHHNNNNNNNRDCQKPLFNRKTERNKEIKRSLIFESKHDSQEGEKFIAPITRKISQPNMLSSQHASNWSDYNSSHNIAEKPLHIISASVHTLLHSDYEQTIRPLRPPPNSPLPPLPMPRKSKSISDLHQTRGIESPSYLSTGTSFNLRRSAKHLAMKKVEEQASLQPSTDISVNLLRHYDTRKKRSPVFTASIRRSTLPWRNKTMDTSETISLKNGRSILANSRTSLKNAFRRNRLVVSARPRLENNEKNSVDLRNNWLSASRRKLRQTCDWLRRDRTSKTRKSHPLTKAEQQQEHQQSLTQQIQSQDDPKFLCPELPKPFFLLPKQEVEYAVPVVEPQDRRQTDYLPMSHENYSDNQPLTGGSNPSGDNHQAKSPSTKKSPIDEYVTDLIHIQHINYPNLILSDSFISPSSQLKLPPIIAPMKQPTSDILNTNTMMTTNNTIASNTRPVNSNNNDNTNDSRPIRPPRHQKLQITGNLYSIQTFANNDNTTTTTNNNNVSSPATGLEVNKARKTDRYLPLDYELPLPPPPPPPPFMLTKEGMLKTNADTLTDISHNMTEKKLSLFPLPPVLSPKPKNINMKPLRSAKIPPQSTLKTGEQKSLNSTFNDQYNNSIRLLAQKTRQQTSTSNNSNTGSLQQDTALNTTKNTS